jgi:hypothetical protein
MTKTAATRREAAKLAPEILGQYHDLLVANDLEGFDMLLEIYKVPQDQREDQRREFMHYAERILRRKWRGLKRP